MTLDAVAHEVRRGEPPARADAHGVRAARAVHAPSAPGADAARRSSSTSGATTSAPRRTRSASTWATCAARPRRAASAAAAHGARRRLHTEGTMSFQRRVMLASAAAVARRRRDRLARDLRARSQRPLAPHRPLAAQPRERVRRRRARDDPGRAARPRIQLFGRTPARRCRRCATRRALRRFPNHPGDVTQIFGLMTGNGSDLLGLQGPAAAAAGAAARARCASSRAPARGTLAASTRRSAAPQYRVLAAGVEPRLRGARHALHGRGRTRRSRSCG